LYDRFVDPILNYCYYRLGAWEEAEDAAQQIFANAYAELRRFRPGDGSVRAWLFTIAHHEVANRQRTRARHPSAPLTAAAGLHAGAGAESVLERTRATARRSAGRRLARSGDGRCRPPAADPRRRAAAGLIPRAGPPAGAGPRSVARHIR